MISSVIGNGVLGVSSAIQPIGSVGGNKEIVCVRKWRNPSLISLRKACTSKHAQLCFRNKHAQLKCVFVV